MFTANSLLFAGCVAWLVSAQVTTAVQPKRKVILDTDAGIDDEVALAFAISDDSVEVLAITCVRGNTEVDNVVVNVLKLLRACKRTNIPVYSGNDHGYIVDVSSDMYFGTDGLGDLPYTDPPSVTLKQKEHAAIQMVKLATANPGEMTLICLGPLTNLALAISLNPNFLSLVKDVIILGGTSRGVGNKLPGVEFNFYCDPDAAYLVMQRASLFSQTVTLVPIEPISDAEFSLDWRWNKVAQIKSNVITFLNQIEKRIMELYPDIKEYTPYDGSAVGVLLVPGFVTGSQQLYVAIDPHSQTAQGAVLIDHYNTTQKAANVNLVTQLNATAYQEKFFQNFKKFNVGFISCSSSNSDSIKRSSINSRINFQRKILGFRMNHR